MARKTLRSIGITPGDNGGGVTPAIVAGALPQTRVVITPPRTETATITVFGTSPLIQNNFSSENRQKMELTQRAGSAQKRTRKAKPPKDFERIYQGSRHISTEGWDGIPCISFRAAMIDATTSLEIDMKRTKMFTRVIADGYDRSDGTPLVRITKGKPSMKIHRVRIGMGQTDLAARAFFEPGWECKVTVEWDADIFQATDIANLLARAGRYVGVGAGRQLSKNSAGIGCGHFDVRV